MRFLLAVACSMLLIAPAFAQLGERPGTSVDTSAGYKDLTGLSIKTPRTRIVHTTDAATPGGSMYFQVFDPFLAFKMGKDLTQREFRPRDGVFSSQIAGFKGLLSDGETPAIVGNDQVSCGGCHAMPYRDAGAGTNFAKKSGLGRNATHFYGSGIQEMIAWQIRQKLMQQIDLNRNNFVDLAELTSDPVYVRPNPVARKIDFGSPGDADGDGQPDLNNIFRVWFVDAGGSVLPGATSLDDPGVGGYNFILEVFGWGEQRFNLNTTNRIFAWDPLVAHGGLEAHDPTTALDLDNDGFSQVSNAGLPAVLDRPRPARPRRQPQLARALARRSGRRRLDPRDQRGRSRHDGVVHAQQPASGDGQADRRDPRGQAGLQPPRLRRLPRQRLADRSGRPRQPRHPQALQR